MTGGWLILIVVLAPLAVLAFMLVLGALGDRANRDEAYRTRMMVRSGTLLAVLAVALAVDRAREEGFGVGFWLAVAMFILAVAGIIYEIRYVRRRAGCRPSAVEVSQ